MHIVKNSNIAKRKAYWDLELVLGDILCTSTAESWIWDYYPLQRPATVGIGR